MFVCNVVKAVFRVDLCGVLIFNLLDIRIIEGKNKMTILNVRLNSSFSLHKNTTTF